MTIGIDVGGTKIEIGIMNAEGILLDSVTIPTRAEIDFSYTFIRICDVIDVLIQQYCSSRVVLTGIGLGSPGPLDLKQGKVCNPYTLPGWVGVPIVDILKDKYNCPVVMENDADAALIGELNSRKTLWQSAVMLTFGTGIGGAVLQNGELFRCRDLSHPEFGHLIVSNQKSTCYCGGSGCLESLASGAALSAAAKEYGYDSFPDLLSQEGLSSRTTMIINQWVDLVSKALWNFLHMFSPQLIILGGGAMESLFDHVFTAIQDLMRKSIFYGHVTIEKAQLGSQAGMIGAAALVSGQFAGEREKWGLPV